MISKKSKIVKPKSQIFPTFAASLSDGVIGNTSGFGPEESRFDP